MLGDTETCEELVRDPGLPDMLWLADRCTEMAMLAEGRLRTIEDLARDLDRWRTLAEQHAESINAMCEAHGQLCANFRSLQDAELAQAALLFDTLGFLQDHVWPAIQADGFAHATVTLTPEAAESCQVLLTRAFEICDPSFLPVPRYASV